MHLNLNLCPNFSSTPADLPVHAHRAPDPVPVDNPMPLPSDHPHHGPSHMPSDEEPVPDPNPQVYH